MSTKTTLKRLALVAVSSMGLGLLTVVPAKAAVIAGTSTISPVRVSFTGANQDSIPAADVTLVTTDAAAEAIDAATDAVEELATQVSTLFASLKAQITTLGNTVAKIAKKVRA